MLLCTASINSFCLISLDRYWSITKAIHYSQQRTPRRAAIMIFIVWFVSATICIPPLIGWNQPSRNYSHWPICTLSEDIGYVLYSSMGSFYIPAIIMFFVYFKIYQVAKHRARKSLNSKPSMSAVTSKSDLGNSLDFDISPKNQPRLTTCDHSLALKDKTSTISCNFLSLRSEKRSIIKVSYRYNHYVW